MAAEKKVVFDNLSSEQISNLNVISWSHTVGNETNRMLVVGIGIKASSTSNININQLNSEIQTSFI